MFGSGAVSNEAVAHPVIVPAANWSHSHPQTLKSIFLQTKERVNLRYFFDTQ